MAWGKAWRAGNFLKKQLGPSIKVIVAFLVYKD